MRQLIIKNKQTFNFDETYSVSRGKAHAFVDENVKNEEVKSKLHHAISFGSEVDFEEGKVLNFINYNDVNKHLKSGRLRPLGLDNLSDDEILENIFEEYDYSDLCGEPYGFTVDLGFKNVEQYEDSKKDNTYFWEDVRENTAIVTILDDYRAFIEVDYLNNSYNSSEIVKIEDLVSEINSLKVDFYSLEEIEEMIQ